MWFVERLLGATESLKTSSEKAADWKCCMRASMRADGMTSCPRCDLAEAAGLDNTGGTKVDPYTAESESLYASNPPQNC